MNAKSNDISTRFVKCPILSKRASFSEANFLPKKELSFLHKNHKNDLVEKKNMPFQVRTDTFVSPSLSLSLSLCVSVFCIDI
jgi:hypothetical protein